MTIGVKPTEMLRQEHQHVLAKLNDLESIIGQLGKKETDSGQLRRAVAFFETDFWVHFTKEEEALFPRFDEFIPRDGGPVGMMLIEHDDLRKTNAEFQQAVAEHLGGSDSAAAITKHGSHFIGVLREHIDKEDNILFMMAEEHLDAAQMEEIRQLFESIEKTAASGQ